MLKSEKLDGCFFIAAQIIKSFVNINKLSKGQNVVIFEDFSMFGFCANTVNQTRSSKCCLLKRISADLFYDIEEY